MPADSPNPTILKTLQLAWKDVENLYRAEKINSERCLQAGLYYGLRRLLDSNPAYTILIEPNFRGTPDLVIRDERSVQCFVELKCAPHYYVKRPQLMKDIQKLIGYSESVGSKIRLDIFGPRYYFDVTTRSWKPSMPEFEVTDSTLYVFGILTRHDDPAGKASEITSLLGKLGKRQRFCLLSGIMNPDADMNRGRCVFDVTIL